MKQLALLLISIALVYSCSPSGNSKTSASGSEIKLADFYLEIPEGWKRVQSENTMRIAQVDINENAQYSVAFFFFGIQDMVEANITRWENQYTEKELIEDLNPKNKNIRAIKIVGTFKKKEFPMAENFTEYPGYGTLAAIIPSKEGPFYLKLTAPISTITKEEENFIALLDSYQRIDE